MRIGLDFGGVIEPSTKEWAQTVRELLRAGHEVSIISHAVADWDYQKRVEFCRASGATNLTFIMLPDDEEAIMERKLGILQGNRIEIYVDDYAHRCEHVMKRYPSCLCLYSPHAEWEKTLKLVKGLA